MSAESRIVDPENSSYIYEWLISDSADDKGNRVAYQYKEENDENVPNVIYETNRSLAKRYLSAIRYGNYPAGEPSGWAFQIAFDYGDIPLGKPDRSHAAMGDARRSFLSTYRPGFEIRTRRRCRRTLLFHAMPEELGEPLTLVREMRFSYDASPVRSLLIRVEEIAHRVYDQVGVLISAAKTLPPSSIDTRRSILIRARSRFNPFAFPRGKQFPEANPASAYRMVDLYGDGLPGVLYVGATTVVYWRPLGEGAYAAPETLPCFLEPFRYEILADRSER